MTERSDAVCVVVSEERGQVSLAEHGKIAAFKKKSEFQRALDASLLLEKFAKKSSALGTLDFLRSNWRLKLLSGVVAVLLWFGVVGPKKSELGISVPIQYTNLPQGMEITGKWMDKIDVRVRGPESGLANLNPGSIRAVVDLGYVFPGLNYFRITGKKRSGASWNNHCPDSAVGFAAYNRNGPVQEIRRSADSPGRPPRQNKDEHSAQ